MCGKGKNCFIKSWEYWQNPKTQQISWISAFWCFKSVPEYFYCPPSHCQRLPTISWTFLAFQGQHLFNFLPSSFQIVTPSPSRMWYAWKPKTLCHDTRAVSKCIRSVAIAQCQQWHHSLQRRQTVVCIARLQFTTQNWCRAGDWRIFGGWRDLRWRMSTGRWLNGGTTRCTRF